MGQLEMLAQAPAAVSLLSEKDLRHQIDRAVSRALFDRDYASELLADPTIALQDHGCPPQQYLSLRGIKASDLVDFAHQARARFWVEPLARQPRLSLRDLNQEEQRPLVAAAAS
jgi:hypothetical protein